MENTTPSEQNPQEEKSNDFSQKLKDLMRRSKQTNEKLDKLREETRKLIHPESHEQPESDHKGLSSPDDDRQ